MQQVLTLPWLNRQQQQKEGSGCRNKSSTLLVWTNEALHDRIYHVYCPWGIFAEFWPLHWQRVTYIYFMVTLYCWVIVAVKQENPCLFSIMCSPTQVMNAYHLSIRIHLILRPRQIGAEKMYKEGMGHRMGVEWLQIPQTLCPRSSIVRR